ncbi:MAG: hypothetical protein V1821_02380, partial [bacterium]
VDTTKDGANVALANQQLGQLMNINNPNKAEKAKLKFMLGNVMNSKDQIAEIQKMDPDKREKFMAQMDEAHKAQFGGKKDKEREFAEFQSKNMNLYGTARQVALASDDRLAGMQTNFSAEALDKPEVVNAMRVDALASIIRSTDKPKEKANLLKNISAEKFKEVAGKRLNPDNFDAKDIAGMVDDNDPAKGQEKIMTLMASFTAAQQEKMRSGETGAAMRQTLRKAVPKDTLVSGATSAELAERQADTTALAAAQQRLNDVSSGWVAGPKKYREEDALKKTIADLQAKISVPLPPDKLAAPRTKEALAAKLELFATRDAGKDSTQHMSAENTLGIDEVKVKFTNDVAKNDVATIAKSPKQAAVLLANMSEKVLGGDNDIVNTIMADASPEMWTNLAQMAERKEISEERLAALQQLIARIEAGEFGADVKKRHEGRLNTPLVANFLKT